MSDNPIKSPCVKICVLDASAGHCRGCGRSLSEIERWTRMSEEERRRIMAELPSRLVRYQAAQRAAG